MDPALSCALTGWEAAGQGAGGQVSFLRFNAHLTLHSRVPIPGRCPWVAYRSRDTGTHLGNQSAPGRVTSGPGVGPIAFGDSQTLEQFLSTVGGGSDAPRGVLSNAPALCNFKPGSFTFTTQSTHRATKDHLTSLPEGAPVSEIRSTLGIPIWGQRQFSSNVLFAAPTGADVL